MPTKRGSNHVAGAKMQGAPGLDFETWESTNLNERLHAVTDFERNHD